MPQSPQRDTSGSAVRRAVAVVALVAGATGLVADAGGAQARENRAAAKEVRRAKPPAAVWDRSTLGTFRDDAFAELVGERPDFAAVAATSAGGPAATAGGPAAVPTGFRWSTLVSEETLTDEIKDLKGLLTKAVASASTFKGGGYDQARDAFSTTALAFAVIAAYDQDIRWQKDAAAIRDLFARVGFNCKVGTDQSFAESKARLEDLEAMLDGSPPKAKPDRDEDFAWSQVAGRPALMNRLEEAQDAMRPAVASKADFGGAVDELRHAVEIVAVIGEVIQQPDFEYHDDDTYRGHAAAMRDAAADVREACDKKDYEAARAAAGRIEKACDACHGEYRS